MIWFTSDTHFGHTNILKFCNRPWKTIEEMDEALIQNWNERIGVKEIVYHLGDFSFRSDPSKYWNRLNGQIHLLLGNHDHRVSKELSKLAVSVRDVALVKYNGEEFFLNHYSQRVWPKAHHGTYHLYGHSHGQLPGIGRSMDVGVDAQHYKPISIEKVILALKDKSFMPHHNVE